MGRIVKLTCNCITEEKTVQMGLGIRDNMHTIPREIGFCPVCKTFQSVQENESCICGGTIQRVYTTEQLIAGVTNMICPNCKQEMSVMPIGRWD